jgi:ankyrin repeat protein
MRLLVDSATSMDPSHHQPSRPMQKSDSLSMLLDPLLELCPSLHSIQSLCLLPVSSLPDSIEKFRRRRLEKAILRAASNGDTELLSWICYIKSKIGSGSSCPEANAIQGLDWDDIRDEDGTGPLNLASSSGHAEIVQMLVRHGANVDERDACEYT